MTPPPPAATSRTDELREALAKALEIQRRLLQPFDGEDDEAFNARRAVSDEWVGALEYKGNSVSWTHSKAKRYGDDLMKAWDALSAKGIKADGNTHIADAIASTPDVAGVGLPSMDVTPIMIAAAWKAFRGDRQGPLHGPGPAFVEAIKAALLARGGR